MKKEKQKKKMAYTLAKHTYLIILLCDLYLFILIG